MLYFRDANGHNYRGHHQTLLPVREINFKACAPVILKQFIQLN